jgi:uncharacterized repeat protein (TIGR03803 family)
MRLLDRNCRVLGVCAVALLAGCGGSGAPLSPSAARVPAERMHVRPAYAVLYSFKGGTDGALPYAGLVEVNDTLYGTTDKGGAKYGPTRCGTVYSLTMSGAERVLHKFHRNLGDGADSQAHLLNVNGTLYGTTLEGGANGYGTVFSITASGTEKVLYSFKGGAGDGAAPAGGLTKLNGMLYGTTAAGGATDNGTVFAITTAGKERVLHSFDVTDGWYPTAGLVSVKGMLYGTTDEGGANIGTGTVFAITTSGKETVLHSFAGGKRDGYIPVARLLNVNGTLYGTTLRGGAHCEESSEHGCGTVFSITTSGKERVLYSFGATDTDGALPRAGLINVNGTLYGTTELGGTSGRGTVFSLSGSPLIAPDRKRA